MSSFSGGTEKTKIGKESATLVGELLRGFMGWLRLEMSLPLVVNTPWIVFKSCKEASSMSGEHIELAFATVAKTGGPEFRFELLCGTNGASEEAHTLGCDRGVWCRFDLGLV